MAERLVAGSVVFLGYIAISEFVRWCKARSTSSNGTSSNGSGKGTIFVGSEDDDADLDHHGDRMVI